MSEELKITLIMLVVDGSNWTTYPDRLQWVMATRNFGDHFTSTSPTQCYTDAGTVGSATPRSTGSWMMLL
jgi:hypothetical protein